MTTFSAWHLCRQMTTQQEAIKTVVNIEWQLPGAYLSSWVREGCCLVVFYKDLDGSKADCGLACFHIQAKWEPAASNWAETAVRMTLTLGNCFSKNNFNFLQSNWRQENTQLFKSYNFCWKRREWGELLTPGSRLQIPAQNPCVC